MQLPYIHSCLEKVFVTTYRCKLSLSSEQFGADYEYTLIIMMLTLIKIYTPAGHEQSVIDVLDTLKGPVTAISDCLDCTIMVEAERNSAICYMEQWRSREALEQHLRSALFSRVLEAMECSCQPPKIEFYEVNIIGGLELVEQARLMRAVQ